MTVPVPGPQVKRAPSSPQAMDRQAAARSGWNVVERRDAVAVAWSRALFSTPRGAGRIVHACLAALCWPGLFAGLLAVRRGWFHREDRRLVVVLRPRRVVPWWTILVVILGTQLLVRVLRGLLGNSVMVVLAVLLAYAALVIVCVRLRRRELRPRAERQGFLRESEAPAADWTLVRVEHRDGLVHESMSAVLALIGARVPPGATIGAAPSYAELERDLTTIGFAPVPGARGHVALTVPEATTTAREASAEKAD